MKPGDPVMVKRGDSWRLAKLLPFPEPQNSVPEVHEHARYVQFNEPGMVGYSQEWAAASEVKRFQPLAEGVQDAKTRKEFDEVKPLIARALEKFHGGAATENDGVIAGYSGSVTLEPVVMQRQTIGAVIEHPGYSVSTWKYIPGTRWEPDNYEPAVVGEYLHIGDAAKVFVQTIMQCQVQDYFENSQILVGDY